MLRDLRLIKKVWNCPHCRHPIDRKNIEQRLIDIVRKRSVAFQTQDLVCEKCQQVKADNMLSTCTNCSAAFRLKQDADSFKRGLSVFSSIAKYHDFKFLQDTVDWILQVIPLTPLKK
jgi:DNA polymerase epsilon subunit 1